MCHASIFYARDKLGVGSSVFSVVVWLCKGSSRGIMPPPCAFYACLADAGVDAVSTKVSFTFYSIGAGTVCFVKWLRVTICLADSP